MSPPSNIVVGLGRSLPKELPYVILQFLAANSLAEFSAAVVAKTFLRLAISGWSGLAGRYTFYATELELKVEERKVLIPRIVLDAAINDRFNSTRSLSVYHCIKGPDDDGFDDGDCGDFGDYGDYGDYGE
ncbi:hypothetical protein DHEL01_v209507 [Diaporthe helianthi]|uniref:Uncharacterized protein n=1 Tax=Diaporthe helianthi TaxID=158607 RepID=A0A2P5HPA6_DIAHE|nr:hypothetical protein DHEL01_v209507 [Diaporthe helianthi]